jgi:hypothetical protein
MYSLCSFCVEVAVWMSFGAIVVYVLVSALGQRCGRSIMRGHGRLNFKKVPLRASIV